LTSTQRRFVSILILGSVLVIIVVMIFL